MPKKGSIGNDGKRNGGHSTYKSGKKLARDAWKAQANRETENACRPRDNYVHRRSG